MDASWIRHCKVGRYWLLHDAFYNPLQLHHDYIYILLSYYIIMIYHLNFSYYEKKSKFQVKFHVFCKFEKKSLVYTNFSGPGGVNRLRSPLSETSST